MATLFDAQKQVPAAAAKDWSEWMPKAALADKLAISLKTFNKAINAGRYEVESTSRERWRLRIDNISETDRQGFKPG